MYYLKYVINYIMVKKINRDYNKENKLTNDIFIEYLKLIGVKYEF